MHRQAGQGSYSPRGNEPETMKITKGMRYERAQKKQMSATNNQGQGGEGKPPAAL